MNDENLCVALFRRFDAALDIFLHGGHNHAVHVENQRERMAYAHYKELGLPIGSGIVEAACKTLGTQRLKRSGMSWNDGKQPILTIRSLQQSDRWERAWKLIAKEFRRTPALVNNLYHFDTGSLEVDMAA